MTSHVLSSHPAKWQVVPLDLLADIIRGITFPATSKRTEAGPGLVRCLRTTNVQDTLETDDVLYVSTEFVRRDDQWLSRGDIVISMANSYELVGKVAFAAEVTERTTFGGFVAAIRARHVDPKFLMYQLRSSSARLALRAGASQTVNIANISLATLKPLQIVLPPLQEQRRVVEALDSHLSRLEAAAASLHRAHSNLKAYRASVLKSAADGTLVQTEADLAKRERREYEPGSVLLGRILQERRRRWEEAEFERLRRGGRSPRDDRWKARYEPPRAANVRGLPPLPEGWCWASVDQLTDGSRRLAYGVLVPGPDVADGVPLIRVGDLRDGTVDPTALKRIDRTVADQFTRTYVEGGEVLISLVGTIGRTALVPGSLAGANVARAIGVLPPTKLVSARWIELWFRSPTVRAALEGKAHEVARKTLNLEDVRVAPVALPPLPEQERLVEEVSDLESTALVQEASVRLNQTRIRTMRQCVLKWAFQGRLVDPDPADEPVEKLLARIRAERATSTTTKKAKKGKERLAG